MYYFLMDSENCTCSQEQGEESSAACFADIPACVLLRSIHTAEKSCCNGNETASCQGSPSGTTCEPSTAGHGADVSISSPEDFRAKTSVYQGRVQESPEQGLGYGLSFPASSARYDRASSSWKIHPCLFPEGSIPCLVTLPRWGMMRHGELWARGMPARLTSGTESGSWPTPKASAGGPDFAKVDRSRTGLSLQTAVAMWPTPTAQDSKNNGAPSQMVRNTKPLNAAVGGSLNPTWVEWLMGWPLGWTDCEPLEMDKFHAWLHSHGKYLTTG